MLRIVLGVIAGFIAWIILWVGVEKVLSAIWQEFGVHQKAFEDVLKNGGSFTAETGPLLTHIVIGSIVSVMAGSLAALIAGENSRAPMIVGCLLLAMGIAKAVMSWPMGVGARRACRTRRTRHARRAGGGGLCTVARCASGYTPGH